MLYKDTNNSKIKNYYKTYCKILSKVIKTAKRHHFNIIIIIIYYAFIRSIQGHKPIGYRTCHWIVHKEKYSG